MNDFCVTPTSASEALRMFGHRKVPCMLFYMRRDCIDNSTALPLKSAPVLKDEKAFHDLCSERPLNNANLMRHIKPTFECLSPTNESPGRGRGRRGGGGGGGGGMMTFGIDCEFVALSKSEKKLHADGSETVTKAPRLVLARVSVVRGEGPKKGLCCIDDYVCAVDPVFDYLTRYSGLREGDLDKARSKHHLTTLKKTYVKLRHLVDMGCSFVGHGLQSDFKMINMTVPPSQIIDTVDLFRLRKQRKLSLMFLAGKTVPPPVWPPHPPTPPTHTRTIPSLVSYPASLAFLADTSTL